MPTRSCEICRQGIVSAFMKARPTFARSSRFWFSAVSVLVAVFVRSSGAAPLPGSGGPSPNGGTTNWTAAQDHRNMMEQLGIKALRPGPSGRSGATNEANYDPAKANPFPDLPDPLTLKNGQKVTTAEMWWKQRRPEIVEDFEREVIGRVPKNVPKVTWQVTETVNTKVGELPVVAKQVIGHVDNSAYPEITVDIKLAVVTPAGAKAAVPVLMMF